jgi:Ca2+-transporting ATPase
VRTTDVATGRRGLTERQAARRLAEFGPNTIPERRPPGIPARVIAQLRDPMIMLLLGAAVLALSLRDVTDTAVIAVVIVLNTAVGVAQELRAERALTALRRLSAPTARVVRDGNPDVRPAAELVPGDLVLVAAGDVVPADGRLLEAHRLQADESALTGESVPVDKDPGVAGLDVASAGTVITSGRGVLLVTRTGATSALGRLAALIGEQRPRPTPLQQRLAALGWVLAGSALALSALVVASGLVRGRPLAEMVLTGVSLAVAAVPESLPAVVTLALALGAHRMARRAAVVRRLPAVETLGSVTVVAADKTGTLTQGRMAVARAWVPEAGHFTFSGAGYQPCGTVTPQPVAQLRELLRDAVLCNDAELRPPDGEHADWRPAGDPMEAALLVAAARAGMPAAEQRAVFPRHAEVPFDAASRLMTTVHRRVGGPGWLMVCKGAPEVLLGAASPVGPQPAGCRAGRLLPADERVRRAREVAARLAGLGHRVIAVADGVFDRRPDPAQPPRALRLVGLLAVADPPRPDAGRVVAALRSAGVRLMMITGDHPDTARAVAVRIGMDGAAGEVVTGTELAGGLPAQRADQARVYARIRPEQKLDIVRAWQARGHVVAMTGDGVNDAPALRRADIGVAMGRDGTDVAREAADLVLTDDNLHNVVGAIEEGRRIYANVRTFLRYALSGGVAEVAVMLLGPLLGLAVPLRPAQILWVNMLTHGLPGVALGAEPADPSIMRAGPRSPREFVLGGGLWRRVVWTGALIAAVTLGVGWWAHRSGGAWQTCVFLTLGLAQLGVALALRRRSPRPGGRRGRPRFLDVAVAGAVALQLAGVYLPPVRTLLGTEAVGATELAVATMAALIPAAAVIASRSRWAAGTRAVLGESVTQGDGPAHVGAATAAGPYVESTAAFEGALLHVEQPAAPGGVVDAGAVVLDVDDQRVARLDGDDDLAGAGVPNGVADRLADDGLGVLADPHGHDGVHGAGDPHRG